MAVFNAGFPSVAFYIPDKDNLNARIPFKCRILDEGAQFYSQPISGGVDIGASAALITWKKFEFKTGAKVILNDVLYSVESISPYIPDPAMLGFVRGKANAEYVFRLI